MGADTTKKAKEEQQYDSYWKLTVEYSDIHGTLFNNVLDEKSKMGYNFETKQYEKAVLLKQGSYNYQYLFVPTGSSVGQTGPIEGNYYQTQNEYSIYVYYRPMGARYDRLIGVTTVRNEMQVF